MKPKYVLATALAEIRQTTTIDNLDKWRNANSYKLLAFPQAQRISINTAIRERKAQIAKYGEKLIRIAKYVPSASAETTAAKPKNHLVKRP